MSDDQERTLQHLGARLAANCDTPDVDLGWAGRLTIEWLIETAQIREREHRDPLFINRYTDIQNWLREFIDA